MAAPTGSMRLLAVIMISGGVALLVLGRHKLLQLTIQSNSSSSSSSLSTLSSGDQELAKRKTKKKKVRFAEELEECFGEKQDDDREVAEECRRGVCAKFKGDPVEEKKVIARKNIPANRIALYNGMLRYRMNRASFHR